jgi:hypothetical protein
VSQIASLSTVYSGPSAAAAARLTLEQEPVVDNRLTTTDLIAMLALVRSGFSAKTYRPASCPASVVAGQVVCPLDVWAWPVPLDLAYTMHANQGSLGARIPVVMEREFDLVINFERTVQLPFVTSALTWAWSDMPCLDARSNVVASPTVTATASSLSVDADIVGVLRVRCAAVGWLHTLVLRFDKGAEKITDIDVAVSAKWVAAGETSTLSQDLELPGCLETLLETCDDGDLAYERASGKIIQPEDTVPVVYYSECDGQKLAIRFEQVSL